MPKPTGSSASFAPPTCTNQPRSNRRWDSKHKLCCGNWMRLAPMPTSSSVRLRRLLISTRTSRSSPVFPDSVHSGARMLAEIGDDRSRFTDARALKAYAGSAPVTRASGKSLSIRTRKVKNQRLATTGYVWAFAALTSSTGAREHYDRPRHAGDRHVVAERNLFNRLLGCLHHCLQTPQIYSEQQAFPTPCRLRLDYIHAWGGVSSSHQRALLVDFLS